MTIWPLEPLDWTAEDKSEVEKQKAQLHDYKFLITLIALVLSAFVFGFYVGHVGAAKACVAERSGR